MRQDGGILRPDELDEKDLGQAQGTRNGKMERAF
jgi:hypothetical protein